MADVRALFATLVWDEDLSIEPGWPGLRAGLLGSCRMLEAEDAAGRAWSRRHRYGGYTSYGSLADLPHRTSAFALLARRLARSAGGFAKDLAFDLGPRGRLALDSLWVS